MNPPAASLIEPMTEPELLEDARRLPTEDDLPYDDGEPMDTARHRDQMNLLIDSLKAHWSERTNYFVGGNMFLHFDPANRRRCRGPDVFLVLNVEDRERKSWVVWQEGMRFPDLIIELLSDTTRAIDAGQKKDLYEQLFRTPEYYLYDPYSQQFQGYHLECGRYRPVAPDAGQRIYSPVTELYLGVRENWLRWISAEDEPLPSPQELAERHRQYAEQEKQRAEQEKQRAEQEKRRADLAEQRAEREKRRADLTEQRAARLVERLRALGIEPDESGR